MKLSLLFDQTELFQVADIIIKKLQNHNIVTLSGDLAAGKTTLVKTILKQLGVKEHVTSPTYNYVSVYRLESGVTIYHFDLYRLKDETQFLAAGFQEYLDQEKSYVFIEWPECITQLLADKNSFNLRLNHHSKTKREIQII